MLCSRVITGCVRRRQRVAVIPHLISYCNSCLQALLPQQASSLAGHLSSSPRQLTKPTASYESPHAQAASDRAVSSAAASLADLASASVPADGTNSENPKVPQAVADVLVEKRADLKGPGLQRPALEGPLGQALAEATVEMLLAVLRNSEDPGQHSSQTSFTTLHAVHW